MPANSNNSANLGFENKLWQAADNLRGHMDAAEYKHVVLGLIFLKYISDAFNEHYQQLEVWTADLESEYHLREPQGRFQVLEDREEYLAENIEDDQWIVVTVYETDPNQREADFRRRKP